MSRKKTHEEYVAELAIKNPNVEVVGKYIDSNTKITHRCKIHDIEWNISPTNILNGGRCRECRKESYHKKRCKTHEQYVNEVMNVNPNIIVIDKYINSDTAILHKCLKDGYEWCAIPYNILKGQGCPKCAGVKKKTHEEYVSELAIKNPSIEVIGEYIDAKTKILHHCLIHDVYWDVLPSNALKGKGCRECMKDKNRNKFLKNHEEYVSQVKHINPNIEVLQTYIGTNSPILHKCLIHNVEWEVSPSSILNGCGCPKCKTERIRNKLIKSHDQYVEELLSINPHIEVVENYIDGNTPILHHCKTHNVFWKQKPNNALQGKGCYKCGVDKIHKANAMSHEDYVKKINLINPSIMVVGKYINCKTKIRHYCLKHNIYWDAYPESILHESGCPQCRGDKIREKNCLTHEQYIEKLKNSNSNIVVLERYIDMKTPILHKCIIHNTEWVTTPSSVLQGCGCAKCKSEKISESRLKSHDQYVEELANINPNIIVLGQYDGAKVSILHKCLLDGNEWFTSPSSILNGCGCPQCNESKGEKQVSLWLDEHNFVYERQKSFDDCKDIRTLPFDFYLPNYNIIIEYDGKQHYEPIDHFGGQESFEYTVKHDKIKNEYCKNNGISLLRIPYYKNVEEELNNFLFI